jgi:DNA-binding LacI/PurR family transcriptional regulator
MQSPKPTLRDLAKSLHLALSTVSMALKDHRRISVETRRRVQEAAKALGYVPDPRIANLMGYMKTQRAEKVSAALAYVAKNTEEMHLAPHPIFQNYLLGARERALELGYRLDYFNITKDGLTGKRVASILRSRGIEGVLLPPVFNLHESFEFEFEQFACVTFGHSLEYEPINRVSLNHFSAVFQSLVEMARLGYRRIGFVMEAMRERVQHRWKAAHLMFLDLHREQESIPALEGHFDRDAFLRWFDKYRPAAILSQRVNFTEFLFDEGLACGRDYGFASLARESHDQALAQLASPALRKQLRGPAGIDQNSFYTGRFAVEFLAQEIAHNIKGPPRHPKVMLINGDWYDGKTLPQKLKTGSRRGIKAPGKSRS